MQGEGARTRVVNRAEADIASTYHDLLLGDSALAAATHVQLVEGHRAQRLTFRDRPLCNVLRPRFLTESRLAELERISHTLADLFERAGTYLLDSDHHLDLVGANEDEREIWSVHPGYTGYTTTSRLDSFMVGGHPKFVEYNAESPASIGYCDVLSEMFTGLPAMQTWMNAGKVVQRFHARERLFEALMRAFHEWGGRNASMAIVDWEDVATRRDFELCAEYFELNGVRTAIADPRRFDYRGGTLYLGDTPINLVYRRVLLHELLERKEEAAALLDAYRDGAVCVVNNPRSKLLHKKAIFALLSDRSLGLEMSEDEWQVVDATIPWTRTLHSGPTTYHGETVDLVALVTSRPDRFVLKPVDDYGGRNVLLGWDTSEERWDRTVRETVGKSYVVQERVPIPEADFPVYRDGKLEFVPFLIDTDPLLFDGRIGGILTRISESALLNVTAGSGSTTPTFVAREGEN